MANFLIGRRTGKLVFFNHSSSEEMLVVDSDNEVIDYLLSRIHELETETSLSEIADFFQSLIDNEAIYIKGTLIKTSGLPALLSLYGLEVSQSKYLNLINNEDLDRIAFGVHGVYEHNFFASYIKRIRELSNQINLI